MTIDISARNLPKATAATLFPNGVPEGVDEAAVEKAASRYTTAEDCPGCGVGWAEWDLAHGVTRCDRFVCGWPGRAFFYFDCTPDTSGAREFKGYKDEPPKWTVAGRRAHLWMHPDSVSTRADRAEDATEPATEAGP